jgi:protein-tyrosine phosphatase
MRGHAAKRGYNLCSRARKFAPESDFADFDLIVGMDDENILALQEMATTPEDRQKIHRMTEFCRRHAGDEVPDPYFGETAAFDLVLDILEDAAGGLLERLRQEDASLQTGE